MTPLVECIVTARGGMSRHAWAVARGLVAPRAPRSTSARWEHEPGPLTGRYLVPLMREASAPPETWLVELAARVGCTADDAHHLATSGDVDAVTARLRRLVDPDHVREWLSTAARAHVTEPVRHAADAARAAWLRREPRTHR